jgi:hypothetical protein
MCREVLLNQCDRPRTGIARSPRGLAQNPNEISGFDPDLILRDVPGKSAQWGRQTERIRRPIRFPAIQHSVTFYFYVLSLEYPQALSSSI